MPLDEADLKKIADLIGASTKDLVRAGDLGGVIDTALSARLKDVPTLDAVTAAAKQAAADAAKAADPKSAGKGDPKGDDPALAALKAQIEETNAKLAAAERARVDAERKATADANLTRVRDALVKAGADPEAVHLAIPSIRDSGALLLDGDKVGWKGKDQYGMDTVHDFEAGAKAWVQTSDGKRFVRPVSAQGTGDRVGSRDSATGTGSVTDLNQLRGALSLDSLNF